ncbi:hypothetical protein LWI28_018775 [Acer negundo]|uniref:Uncharacterized protein n=1 Tax=Acer negundo TaxID=4023 RepID=A0AAD5IIZ3_ACENE|nr:hypothetical protein LWI28_018775 [Acer negundo]
MSSRGSKYGSREGFANKGNTSSSKPTVAIKTNTKVLTSKREGVVSKQQQQQQQQPSSSNTNSRRPDLIPPLATGHRPPATSHWLSSSTIALSLAAF